MLDNLKRINLGELFVARRNDDDDDDNSDCGDDV